MKKKIPYAVLSTALCLSLVTPSFAAQPSKGIYIQGGVNKYYSLPQFVTADKATKNAEMNTAELKNVKYYDDETNKIASAHDILWNGLTSMKDFVAGELDGIYRTIVDDQTVTIGEEATITVVGASYVNTTTVRVTFSDAVTQDFTVAAMSVGSNTRTVQYKGNDYTVTVTRPPDDIVPVAAVEGVTFINYREFKVSFNTIVDHASAADPHNYYFEIVDGNAGLFGLAVPNLQDSNQLSEIQTAFPGGAAEYWKKNILATDEGGKTVVYICLPEDARFTNIPDNSLADDIERTLYVNQSISQNGPTTQKELVRDIVVNVAVRNVKDAAGLRTINTAVKAMQAKDIVKPELKGVSIIDKEYELPKPPRIGADSISIGKEINNGEPISLIRTRWCQDRDQGGQALQFQYSEPVFDGHDLDKSDVEYFRDLALYVNGKKVASQVDGNLKNFMSFNMGHSNYNDAKLVTLDVEKAIKATPGETFTTGKDYTIYFVGVTDLAGNIEVASEHYFKVNFQDEVVVPPTIVKPVVLDVAQVADNMFRVEFNRAGVEAKLEITNADGEQGLLKAYVPPSIYDKKAKTYYSYVQVNAMDHELFDPILNINVTKDGCWLAYDGQDYIDRAVKVTNVIVENDSVSADPLLGDDFDKGTMRLRNDILAPVAQNPADVAFEKRGNEIVIPVKDIVPWVDQNIIYDAKAVRYNYDAGSEEFTNEINWPIDNRDYLPVKVSYVDGSGATHSAVVTNRTLRPNAGGVDSTYNNPGYSGSIWYDDDNNALHLNLLNYKGLLDSDNKLVEGAQYKIELPKGYFSDPARDIVLNNEDPVEFTYGGNDYDLEYVDDARVPNLTSIIGGISTADRETLLPRWKELGYTSIDQTVNLKVGTEAPPQTPETYVPQTSKELIRYDQPTNALWVEFTGDPTIASATNPNNYVLNGKTIAEWDQLLGTATQIVFEVKTDVHDGVEVVHKFAKFVIPQDSIQQDGDVEFIVRDVAHKDGAKMTEVRTVVAVLDNYRPVVTDARMTGQRQIVLTFNEPLLYLADSSVTADQYSAAKNFKVTVNGIPLTVLEAVLPIGGLSFNTPSDRELTLNLGSDIPDTGDLKVEIVKDQNGNILLIDKSQNRNPMKLATYNVVRPVQ